MIKKASGQVTEGYEVTSLLAGNEVRPQVQV